MSFLIGKSHFGEDDTQNYLVFQPLYRYFKRVSSTDDRILWWKSRGLSDEEISPSAASDNSHNPALSFYGTKTRVKFTEGCLQQNKITFIQGKIVNTYIVFEISTADSNNNYPTLRFLLV